VNGAPLWMTTIEFARQSPNRLRTSGPRDESAGV
jgi:hypothetical protein